VYLKVLVNDKFFEYFMKYEIENCISNEFFNRFNFDISFIQKDPSTCRTVDKSYQNAIEVVKKLQYVVNDPRGEV